MKPVPWWRTGATLLLFGVGLWTLLLLVPKDARAAQVPVIVGGLVTLGIAATGKSAFEHWTKRGQVALPEVRP